MYRLYVILDSQQLAFEDVDKTEKQGHHSFLEMYYETETIR